VLLSRDAWILGFEELLQGKIIPTEDIIQGKSLLCAAAVCTMLLMNWAASARAADPCDRACLEGYIDKVIEAIGCMAPYGIGSGWE
jgi:hypothetical protein